VQFDLQSLRSSHGRNWWEGQTYARLAANSLVFIVGLIVLGAVLLPVSLAMGTWASTVIVVAAWLTILVTFARRMRGQARPLEALRLCLLLAIVFAGYGVFSIVVAGSAVFLLIAGTNIVFGWPVSIVPLSLVPLGIGLGVLVLLVRLDRFVGRACLQLDADVGRTASGQGDDAAERSAAARTR
jgi:hypothetical protein